MPISSAEPSATNVGVGCWRRDSLYKGEIGVALLAADLGAPQSARLPLFELSGWPLVRSSR